MYLFSSLRLGFRAWNESDLDSLIQLNRNPDVMKYFPSIQSDIQCLDFIKRMQKQMTENGHCYFVVEELMSGKFVGFIGLLQQTFESDFTPAVDIGWRLSPEFWGKGYASEGASRCLEFGWNNIGLTKVISVAPQINEPSKKVMQKIGMEKVKTFDHPLLSDYPKLQPCELHQIVK